MAKPTHILWVSRHLPTRRQRAALSQLFPGYTMVIDPNPFSGVADIIERMNHHQCDEIVLVAPLSVVRAITQHGIKPIWAEMSQVPLNAPDPDTTYNGRSYRFIKFHRVSGVTIVTEPILSTSPTKSQTGIKDKS